MNPLSYLVHSITEEVKEIATKLAAHPQLSLTEVEALLRETTRDWERRLLQGCDVQNATSPTSAVTCPVCQQPMQRQSKATNGL